MVVGEQLCLLLEVLTVHHNFHSSHTNKTESNKELHWAFFDRGYHGQ